MSVRALARQYAHALFDVAHARGRLDEVRRDLTELSALVAAHAELGQALTSPAVSVERKKALIRAVIQALGGLAGEVERLVLLLADRDRLSTLGDVVSAFVERVMDEGRIVQAEITTPAGLGEAAKTALREALSQAVGREVVMTERVDPAMIGGLVAKVGSVVFDGSVTRQIERLHDTLLAEV